MVTGREAGDEACLRVVCSPISMPGQKLLSVGDREMREKTMNFFSLTETCCVCVCVCEREREREREREKLFFLDMDDVVVSS